MSLTLHGFASNLLSDPEAMAAYELDPEGQLAKAGLDDITPQDVQEIMPLVTEFSSAGMVAGDADGAAAGGSLSTPHGDFAAGGNLDLAGTPAGSLGLATPDGSLGLDAGADGASVGSQLAGGYGADGTLDLNDPSGQLGLATPNSGMVFTAGQDGIGGSSVLIAGGDPYEAGGGIDLADESGPAANLGMNTPEGSFGLRVSEDGIDLGGDGAFSSLTDLGGTLDSDALDLTGGASSVASLLAGGADLGPAATLIPSAGLPGLGNLGGFGDLTGGLPLDQLPVDAPQLPLDVPQLPVGEVPMDGAPLEAPQLPQLPVGGDGPLNLPKLPVDLPDLPVELPALPVEVPQIPVVNDPVADVLDQTGVGDVVSDSPVGDLLGHSAGDGPAGDLLPLDLAL